MKRIIIICSAITVLVSYASSHSYAYWIWTAESKKWVNPKYAPKGSPREQYDWAMQFYLEKDYPRATAEFKKLIKAYPQSELAPDAQYYIGRSYEGSREYYAAYQAYQKVMDLYPRSELTEEIIERQYKIGNLYFSGQKAKVFGVALLPALDKAIEIFEKVVENSPYGKYAELAQFKIGECYKKNLQYKEAAEAFGKIVNEYPNSLLYEQAKYEIADCTYRMSFKPRYDQEPTEEAIKEFEEFIKDKDRGETLKEAQQALVKLQEKKAESLFDTARFYERSKRYESAIIYYNEVLNKYPKTSWAEKAFNNVTVLEKMLEEKQEKERKRLERKEQKAKKKEERKKEAKKEKKKKWWQIF